VSSKFELIELDNFTKQFNKKLKISAKDQLKVSERIEELGENPFKGTPMKGLILVSGMKIAGLRHEKYGVANHRGGLAVLYRVCKECLMHKYYQQGTGKKCAFCDEGRPNRVVLFDIYPRQDDYR
jgi:mRNA-degrading endonuclease RelE of RelBE toxin-antitoxin system